MSVDTITCPDCGLSQPSRHVFCTRCDATLRVSAEVAQAAIARAGRLAGGLEDLDLPPDDEDDTTTTVQPPPKGPAWVAPGDVGRRSSAMRERSDRAKRHRSGVPSGTSSVDSAPLDRANISSEGTPATHRTLSVDRLSTAQRSESRPTPSEAETSLRGRPPGALYASENRAPDDDPLMAALLEGIGRDEPSPPPSTRLEEGIPPVRTTDHGVAGSPKRSPGRSRVVPASRGPRRSVTNADQNNPRVRRIAMHPDEWDTSRRVADSGEDVSERSLLANQNLVDDRSEAGGRNLDDFETPGASMKAVPTTFAARTRAQVHGDNPQTSHAPAARTKPAAGYEPESRDRPPQVAAGGETRRWIAVGVMLTVLALSTLGASAGFQRFFDLRAIEKVLDAGITNAGPVPALPKDLDRVLAERDLTDRVLKRVQSMNAATDLFEIRVELRQSVIGIPLSYEVGRDGEFDLPALLPTADFYRSGGWGFDDELEQRVRAYESSGSSEVRKVTSQAEVPLLTEDSGANLPSIPEDEEGEGETEGETPAP